MTDHTTFLRDGWVHDEFSDGRHVLFPHVHRNVRTAIVERPARDHWDDLWYLTTDERPFEAALELDDVLDGPFETMEVAMVAYVLRFGLGDRGNLL